MNKFYKQFLILLISVLSLSLISCDIKSPVEGIDIILNQKAINTTVSVSFVDANTGMQIGSTSNKNIQIQFTGKDKDNILSLKELPIINPSTKNGIISFAIKNSRIPSQGNPVEINVVASADGYSTTSKSLIITKEGANPFKVVMVNLSAPPQGSTVISNPVSSSNGQINNATTVTTGNETVTGGSSTLNIPASTEIKDENGNPVTGTLTATVSYFNNKTQSSLNSFPGGLIANALTQQGSSVKGIFSTAGFAEFTIKNQAGNKVKSFNTPVELSIDIPAGTINKETNAPVKNGDEIPVWSFDESTAEWKFEQTGIASGPDSKGNFKVTVSTNHLSWWNLGWLGENVCASGATINLAGNYASLTLVITNSSDGTFIASEQVSSTQSSISVQNAPAGIPVKIEAFDNLKCSDNSVGTVNVGDLCGADVNLNVSSAGSDVNVTVEAFCPDRDPVLRIRPSIDIYILNECGDRVTVGKMVDGFITLKSLNVGSSYTFGVYYDDDDDPATDNWHQSDPQLIDKNNFDFDYELDADICSDL